MAVKSVGSLGIACAIIFTLFVGTAAASSSDGETKSSRTFLSGTDPDTLPEQLSQKDRQRYREIFAFQEKGRWRQADKRIRKLENRILMGHVLYQRYMHPRAYRSRFKELRTWLASYARQPGAEKIYKLAKKRKPRRARYPQRPLNPKILPRPKRNGSYTKVKRKPRIRLPGMTRKARYLHHLAVKYARRGNPKKAEKILQRRDSKKYLPKGRYDEAKTRVARAYYKAGNDEKAYQLAIAAADRSRKYFAQADWLAGLSAFRQKKFDLAAESFKQVITTQTGSSWFKAAGAFWTARSLILAGKPETAPDYLANAAANPRTFYGLLAVEMLGGGSGIDFDIPDLSSADMQAVFTLPAVQRAKALSEVGQLAGADAELKRLNRAAYPELRQKILILANSFGLPSTQFKLGMRSARRGLHVDAAAYPIPPWQPQDGFELEPALVYAFMRQESAFKTDAKSRRGARGLMQLMPATASFISGDKRLKRGGRNRLFNPRLNITLGQKYLRHLLQQSMVKGDLFRLAVAYNGGPGNLLKWEQTTFHGDDPLLFIESIPASETRVFVEKVLCNYWIYKRRLTGSAPSLAEVAAGKWPTYISSQPRGRGPVVGQLGKQ